MFNNREIGSIGESIAEKYLKKHNYQIIQKNYRVLSGEIDIIASEDKYLVFIEVKARRNIVYGYPREAVTYYKQQKIKEIAISYLRTHKHTSEHIRFDVVEIILDYNYRAKDIKILKNAF